MRDIDPRLADEGYFHIGVDPGGDTGMSLLHIRPRAFTLLDWATVPYNPMLRDPRAMPTGKLMEWVSRAPGRYELLYEDFHLRNNSAEKDTTALRVIGAIEQVVYEHNPFASVHCQEPVEAKYMVTDETLEKLGLNEETSHGWRHVRDSLRHVVTYLTRRRYLPVCRVAYPKGGGVTSPLRPGSRRSGGSTPAR